MRRFRAAAFGALLPLAACQHYAPAPLPEAALLAPAVDPAAQTAPLTVDAVVRLALRDNPDLKTARAARGIADAELIQSGILPNPSLSGAILPLISGVGIVPAWNVGLTQDVKALITYRSKRRAGRDVQGRAAADLLWQEWQVAGQARQLAVDLIGTRRQLPIVEQAFAILSARNAAMDAALRAGNTTLVLAAPTLAAVQAARASRDAVEQRELQLRHQLAALLGLEPDAPLLLAPAAELPPIDPAAIRASLVTLPQRRPDLLALRLGYAAQEESVRQAILSQFPDLVLGATGSSDSSKVVNLGPQATIGLPVFDRGQGNIAIARATRAQLRADYAARLATATGEVAAALTEIEQLGRQLAAQRADLPAVRRAADRAVAARGASAIDEAAYVSLLTARFTKEQDVMTLELAIMDRQVALQTLIGAGLPTVDLLTMTEPAP
ncbi:TolC family protein [Sphingomonas abietis]|uniref:TolC family protein n=1 Tax=Sphingomonas abietis TaxID=3012344 RepID=A0ABY7NJ00_9SPHN|nr:TolC family protein [Sphingomonas abietis]WBO21303.1 TolC family protein [Sphingomonas abietis]